MRIAVVVTLLALSCHAQAPRLTPPQIVRAAGLVHPGDPWSEAYPALVDRLGLPTEVNDGAYSWAARDGPDCYLIEIHTRDGVVAYVDDPYRPTTPSDRGGFRRCTRAAR